MFDKVWVRILTSLSRDLAGKVRLKNERDTVGKVLGKRMASRRRPAPAFNVVIEARTSAVTGCLMEMAFALDRTYSPELQPGVLWQCR